MDLTKGIYSPETASIVKNFAKYGVDVSGKTEAETLDLSKKFMEARKIAPNEEAVKQIFSNMVGNKFSEELPRAKAMADEIRKINRGSIATSAPMETPYGKSLLSYTPEGKIAGKTGAALRGLGKVASRVAGPLGAALTALDLAQGLGEVQEKGAAKIAEDYKNSQLAESEDAGDKLMTEMKPITDTREYSPEERMKLKEILSKYKANAALRSER